MLLAPSPQEQPLDENPTVHCDLCGATLTAHRSIRIGRGPVCAARTHTTVVAA